MLVWFSHLVYFGPYCKLHQQNPVQLALSATGLNQGYRMAVCWECRDTCPGFAALSLNVTAPNLLLLLVFRDAVPQG